MDTSTNTSTPRLNMHLPHAKLKDTYLKFFIKITFELWDLEVDIYYQTDICKGNGGFDINGVLGPMNIETSTNKSKPRFDIHLQVAKLDAYLEFIKINSVLRPGGAYLLSKPIFCVKRCIETKWCIRFNSINTRI